MIILSVSKCQIDEQPDYKLNKLNGFVQKGPYINGTAITLSELNDNLNPTGKTFSSQIFDNKGSFEVNEVVLNYPYVEIRADGFYYDEIKGEKSAAQLTLYGLADISNNSTINVNILTQLEKKRVEYLLGTGLSFGEAKVRAQTEVLNAFGFEYENMISSELLDISEHDDKNAILLAISLIIQGNRSVGDLTELIANISTDLKEDGVLNSNILKSGLVNQARSIDTIAVRENLETRYESMGVEALILDFEKYINDYLENENPIKVSYTTKAVSCHGWSNGEIDLTIIGGTEPYNFQWSNGETTEDLTNLSGGNYSVTVSDANGYEFFLANIEVSEPDSLLITENEVINIIADERSGLIDINVIGGTPPYMFIWSNGSETEDISNLSSKGEYKVTVTDANNCSASKSINLFYVFKDARDGNEYKYTKIGNQTWMAENLAYLPTVSLSSTTSSTKAYYYVYDYQGTDISEAKSTENYQTYGVLYNWVAAQDACPSGWYLPLNEEWEPMAEFISNENGGYIHNGPDWNDVGTHLKSTYGWYNNGNGTDDYGFTALPAGQNHGGDFAGIEMHAFWWTSDRGEYNSTMRRSIYYHHTYLRSTGDFVDHGYSIRCIKD